MKNVLLFLFCFLAIPACFGQKIFEEENLSTVKVRLLSEAELIQINQTLKDQNISITELRTIAVQKGMSQQEFELLEKRLEELEVTGNNSTENKTVDQSKPTKQDLNAQIEKPNDPQSDTWVYGSEIFANKALSFEPNQSLSTPDAYLLGTGDELEVVIYGIQEFTQTTRIDKQGKIFLRNIGSVQVGGLALGAAIQLIEKKASTIYSTLASGRSQLSVTVTNFKTIQITMIGVKQPGNYTLSSLATVFNALHIGGGPSENGSYRNIELIRNNEVIKTIDLYRFLTKGDLSGNVGLQNNDIIRVPTYQTRVEVVGAVKRPGMFELKPTEGFDALIEYASGFAENAYLKTAQLTTTTDTELKIQTIAKDEFNTISFKPGDKLRIGELLETYQNKVTISGAVYRPSDYELTEGMTIYDLVMQADGLTEDAFAGRALLMRKGNQLQPTVIGLNLTAILADSGAVANIPLERDDELIVSSVNELKETLNVRIAGEVLEPGSYEYAENLTVYDLVLIAGGFKESASNKVEIARIPTGKGGDSSRVEPQIFTIQIDQGFEKNAQNFELQPYDVVSVRKARNYKMIEEVMVAGEVNFPGTYAIQQENERIGDIIARSGGLKDRANIKGIKIVRNANVNRTSEEDDGTIIIPIDYKKIVNNQNSDANIRVRNGDQIYVERLIQTTKVNGAVAIETEIPIKRSKSARYYVNAAGGFKQEANKKKTYVIYANGMAKTTKNFLLFKVYPKPDYGSSIIVPEKNINQDGMTTQEVVALSTILSSITGITIAIITLVQP